jgi:hypothetical protein
MDWADGGQTDISDETLACGPHNRLIGPGGWRTRKRQDLLPLRGLTAGNGS